MSFVLDNSVTMRWFFGDGGRAFDAMKDANSFALVTWRLEVATSIGFARSRSAGGNVPQDQR